MGTDPRTEDPQAIKQRTNLEDFRSAGFLKRRKTPPTGNTTLLGHQQRPNQGAHDRGHLSTTVAKAQGINLRLATRGISEQQADGVGAWWQTARIQISEKRDTAATTRLQRRGQEVGYFSPLPTDGEATATPGNEPRNEVARSAKKKGGPGP